MDWERIGRIAGKFFLVIIELVFKLCAAVATAIALAAPGGLSEKIGAGFGSLTIWLRKLAQAPSQIAEMGRMINDFNTQTAADFADTYGAGAIELLIYELNMAVEYLQSVFRNLTQNPFATLLASLVVFLAFYVLARTLRFFRQKGQGSPLTRLERRLGEKAFDLNKEAKIAEILEKSASKRKTRQAANPRASSSKPSKTAFPTGRTRTKPASGSKPESGSNPKTESTPQTPKQPKDSGNEKEKGNNNKPPHSPPPKDSGSGPQSLDGIIKSARSSAEEEEADADNEDE